MSRIVMGLMATCAMLVSGQNAFAEEMSQLTGVAWIKKVSTSATGASTNHDSEQAVFRPGHAQVMFTNADETFDPNHGPYCCVYLKTITSGAIKNVATRGDGAASNGPSWQANFFPGGNSIVFSSASSDFVPNMGYGTYNIFTKNLTTGVVRLVSRRWDGGFAETHSWWPNGSPDGKSVAFVSWSSLIVPNDTNGAQDIFVKNMATGKTTRVSTAGNGAQANGESALTGLIQGFSPDGKFLAFHSYASNLVAGDTNGTWDVFTKNLVNGVVRRISVAPGNRQANGGSYGAAWSPNGNLVSFHSAASNLVAGDTNGVMDIFAKNLTTGAVKRLSTASNGAQANGASYQGVFSPNGKLFAFTSEATNLVAGDTNGQKDVFVKDLTTGKVILISKSATGVLSNNSSVEPTFSSDSTMVAFRSWATNLVPGDVSANADVFVVKLK